MKNYFLCKMGINEDYLNSNLIKLFPKMKSMEQIDMFTSQFKNYTELTQYLKDNKLIDETQKIVIANNKTNPETKEICLRPVFLKSLIFKEDLERLYFKGENYNELHKQVWDYINERKYDEEFIEFIVKEYVKKYEEMTKQNAKTQQRKHIPIYGNGDLSALLRLVKKQDKTKAEIDEYEFHFYNFFNYEIYNCEIIQKHVVAFGDKMYLFKKFIPKNNKQISQKGFHDLLIRLADYSRKYENTYTDEELHELLRLAYEAEKREEKLKEELELSKRY